MKLIDSPKSIEKLQAEWDGVIKMRDRMKLILAVAHGRPIFGPSAGPSLRHVLFNLPLLLAFDVLKQALTEASLEGKIKVKQRQLGLLMEEGKNTLEWLDWDKLRSGVRRRNAIAHDGVLFHQIECISDITAVEAQLIDWEVIKVDQS